MPAWCLPAGLAAAVLNWRHLAVNDETKIATTASAVHARVFMAVWVRNSWTWLVGSSHIHNFYTKLLNKKWYPKINRPMSPCRQSESSVQSCRQIRSVVLTWKRAKNCRKFRAKRVPPIGSTQLYYWDPTYRRGGERMTYSYGPSYRYIYMSCVHIQGRIRQLWGPGLQLGWGPFKASKSTWNCMS